MTQDTKILISSDKIKHFVDSKNKLFRKGVFSELNDTETIPIKSKDLKYIIENKLKNITLNELLEHVDVIKPYSLLYHERKCYLKIFSLDRNYAIDNLYEMFNCFRLKDWYRLPEYLRFSFLNYLKEYFSLEKVKIIDEIINVPVSSYYNAFRTSVHFSNKYVIEYTAAKTWYLSGYFDILLESYPEFLCNKRIMKNFCKRNGRYLEHACDEFKDNYSLVKMSCKNYGMSLKFASKRLQDNEKIVSLASLNNFRSLEFISERLKDSDNLYINLLNDSYISEKLKDSDDYDSYISDICNPREYNLEISLISSLGFLIPCSRICSILNFFSNRIKDNESLVKLAIKQDGLALCYASQRLFNNIDMAKLACAKNGNLFQYLPDNLKNNIKIMIIACSRGGCSLEIIPLQNRKKVANKVKNAKKHKLDKFIHRKMNKKTAMPQNVSRVRKYRV